MENGISLREYNGRQKCTTRGDPTGTYQQVVRVDSGIVKGNGKFQSVLADAFDSTLLKKICTDAVPAQRSCAIQADGFTHAQTYHIGDLEVRVDTWSAPKQRGNPTAFLYNLSVEVEGPADSIAVLKKPLHAYMIETLKTYNLHSLS